MLGGLAKAIFGSSNDRYVKSLRPIVNRINGFEPVISAMSDDELANQTVVFRQRLVVAGHPLRLLATLQVLRFELRALLLEAGQVILARP